MISPPPRSLTDHGRVVARHRHLARRLYEVLGGSVQALTDPATEVRTATAARRWALVADELAALLPEVPTAEFPPFAPDADDPLVARVERIAALSDATERVAAVEREVLPAWSVVVAADLAAASPATDGALLRVLGALADRLAPAGAPTDGSRSA